VSFSWLTKCKNWHTNNQSSDRINPQTF